MEENIAQKRMEFRQRYHHQNSWPKIDLKRLPKEEVSIQNTIATMRSQILILKIYKVKVNLFDQFPLHLKICLKLVYETQKKALQSLL